MLVIGFTGKAGAGKDTAANLLTKQMLADGLSVIRLSFAGKLKDIAVLMFGWDRDGLDTDPFYKEGGLGGWVHRSKPGSSPQTWDEVIQDVNHDSSLRHEDFVELDTDPACVSLGMTRRTIMQRLGTEAMRQGLHPNIWIKLVELAEARGEYSNEDVAILSDARFLNELEFIRPRGLTVNITRQNSETLTSQVGHSSELEWETWPHDWDVMIQNDLSEGIDALKDQVVSRVYTRLVDSGIGQFSDEVRMNLLRRSEYGQRLNQPQPSARVSEFIQSLDSPEPTAVPIMESLFDLLRTKVAQL